jgi:hypothetical protein
MRNKIDPKPVFNAGKICRHSIISIETSKGEFLTIGCPAPWIIRRFIALILLLLIVVPLRIASAQDSWSMLDGIEISKNFRSMRSSSSDTSWVNGNWDARPVPAGETLVLADLKGPGRITHIWCTLNPFMKLYGKKIILKMYWDGEKNPSVEAPINDFFCEGHGIDMNVQSLPFDVSQDGKARNCYFPMPFRKSARIEITNEGEEELQAIYWYVDWQKFNSLPKNTDYFHAKYRQEFPCKKDDGDYLILQAEGKGHYVGCNLSVRSHEPAWWGEGDDRFYIDGESEPSLKGTGFEDYFCQAWGVRERAGLFYGCPLNEKPATYPRVTVYRFHIPDPVPFTKSLKLVIEHKGVRLLPNGKGYYGEREDDYSSVAYWYQAEPHIEFAPMPTLKERLYKTNVVLIEGESLAPTYESTGARPETRELSKSSKGNFLYFAPADEKAFLTVRFSVKETATYITWLHMEKSWDYGIYQVSLDGNPIGDPTDAYNANITQQFPLKLGSLMINAGEHTLKFQCTGKNPLSKGYSLGLDLIEMMPIQ